MQDDKITMDVVEEKLKKKMAKFYAFCEFGDLLNGNRTNGVVHAENMKELSIAISKLEDVDVIMIVKGHRVQFAKKIVLEMVKG